MLFLFFPLASELYGAHRHHRLEENMKNKIVKMEKLQHGNASKIYIKMYLRLINIKLESRKTINIQEKRRKVRNFRQTSPIVVSLSLNSGAVSSKGRVKL